MSLFEKYKLKHFFDRQHKLHIQYDANGKVMGTYQNGKEVKDLSKTITLTDLEFDKLAKEKGYIKKPKILTEAIIAYRTYLFMFVGLLLSELIIFFGSATFPLDGNGVGHWYVSPQTWQALIVNVLKDFGAIVIGKINSYHEQKKQEKLEEELRIQLLKEIKN